MLILYMKLKSKYLSLLILCFNIFYTLIIIKLLNLLFLVVLVVYLHIELM